MTDFFRVRLGIVSRTEGHSAAKRSAYQSCGQVVDHEGKIFDFTRKAAEHVRTFMLTPLFAPSWAQDPQTLWQRAAGAEKRIDAQETRILDFSMPRAVPANLWEACARHVYDPFVRMGMVVQVDIHDTEASDGDRNVNVHGLATLREIDGDGFSPKKTRTWNDTFRERGGRAVREAFAGRLTEFCRVNGIDYKGDARPNSRRGRPAPEPELPKWNFEAAKRGAHASDALRALQQHRTRRREWESALDEQIEADQTVEKLRKSLVARTKRRFVTPRSAMSLAPRPDRRAAILRAWHHADWINADDIAAMARTRFDPIRSCLWIDLNGGGTLIDRGDQIVLRGQLNWQAAHETATAAERHGWTEIEVFGDDAYRDAIAVAAMFRGIAVTNHELSPNARRELDRLLSEQALDQVSSELKKAPEKDASYEISSSKPTSLEIHLQLAPRRPLSLEPSTTEPVSENAAPVLKPPFRNRFSSRPGQA